MKSPQIEIITLNEYRAWYEAHHAQTRLDSPFHQPDWLEAVQNGIGFEIACMGISSGDGLICIVPGFKTRRGPFHLYGSPLPGTMTSYLGPLRLSLWEDHDDLADLVEACNKLARRTWKVDYVEFTLRDQPDEGEDGFDPGWRFTRPESYRLDLRQGEEVIWANLRTRCRRYIRKNQKLGLSIVPLDDDGMYYELVNETLGRRGIGSWHPRAFFRILIKELIPLGLLSAWGTEYRGEIIAAGLFLHNEKEIHFLSGASRSSYRDIPTSYLLHWHVIQWAIQTGREVYDFGGRGDQSGINHFKESFSPEIASYWKVNKAAMHIRVAKSGYLMAKRRLRRLQHWSSS